MESNNKRTCKLVLGNGFDLYYGLKTRYEDFFNSDFSSKVEVLEKEKELRQKLVLGERYESEQYPNLSFSEKVTFWDIVFVLKFKDSPDKQWCDIEEFILEAPSRTNVDKTYLFHDILWHYTQYSSNNLMINDKYLLAVIYLFNKDMNIEDEYKLADVLLEELINFEKKFGQYVYEEFRDNANYGRNIRILSFFRILLSNWSISTIDTFNYTPLEEVKNEDLPVDKEVIYHINGDYRNPIFGIDSSQVEVASPSYYYTKTYRRITSNFFTGEQVNYVLRKDFDDLIIFGHSLNVQDYNFFFPLFDHLELMNVTSKKSIIFCYNIFDATRKQEIIRDNITKLNALISSYEEFKTGNKKQFRLVDSLSCQGRLRFLEV